MPEPNSHDFQEPRVIPNESTSPIRSPECPHTPFGPTPSDESDRLVVTHGQRETLAVLYSLGDRWAHEYEIHLRARDVIPGYRSMAWHGRLATAVRKGWATREGAAGRYRWVATGLGMAVHLRVVNDDAEVRG